MSITVPIASPIKLKPVALCLRLSSRRGAFIPISASPFTSGAKQELKVKSITPGTYGLVCTDGGRWCLRMTGPERECLEMDVPGGTMCRLVDLFAKAEGRPTPRRKRKFKPQTAVLIGVLAEDEHTQLMIEFDPSASSDALNLGVCISERIDLTFDPGARRWSFQFRMSGQGVVHVPFPDKINQTLSCAIERARDVD